MKKKFTSVLLAVVLLFSNTLPVLASENQTTSEAGSKEATVLYDMSADYTITLPKKITLNSTKQSEYSVKVEGDIPSSERVYVSPVDAVDKEDGFNFYMQNQNENSTDEDVLATVTQSKVYWNFQDVSDGVEVTDNTVTAEDLKAGKWKGTFTFEINLKSVTSIDVTAKDSDGNDLNASAEAIIGEEKDNLLDQLSTSGLVDSVDDVDMLIDVKADSFDDLADATFDVSGIANPGDKVIILHYDETKGEWEYIGEDTVGDNGTVSGDFSSFSPVAFVKVTDGNIYEHIHVYKETVITEATCTEDGKSSLACACGDSTTSTIPATGHSYVEYICSRCGAQEPGLYNENNVMTASWDELIDAGTVTVTDGAIKAKTDITGKLIIDDSVTSFKTRAFDNCTKLTSITIPNSITSIGDQTFYNCSSLESIIIPNSVSSIGKSAFSRCSALTDITLPDSVSSIGESAFSRCSALTDITLPDSVTSIEESTFMYCESLASISIPNNVASIGDNAFDECTSLEDVIIPNSVISIGSVAFKDTLWLSARQAENPLVIVNNILIDGKTCSGDIVIPDGVTSISGWAFSYNTELTGIDIPGSVVSIGNTAFKDCSALSSIKLSAGVTSIGYNAFQSCSSLSSIVIPDSVTSIERYVFCDCTSLSSIEIPDSVSSIGSNAFEGCTGLSSVNISDGVTSIGSNAFKGCTSLTDIVIPNSITTIESNAFKGCSKLSTIYIPSSVVTISASSQSYSPFYGCSSSMKIYCGASEVLSGWSTYWNYYGSKALSVTYGISREDYEANYK